MHRQLGFMNEKLSAVECFVKLHALKSNFTHVHNKTAFSEFVIFWKQIHRGSYTCGHCI